MVRCTPKPLLAEYFCVLGPALLEGCVGLDPVALHVFPQRHDCEVLPAQLAPFCFPHGFDAVFSSEPHADRSFETVLTTAEGARLYAVFAIVDRRLTAAERARVAAARNAEAAASSPRRLEERRLAAAGPPAAHAATALCLVSRHSLLAQHRAFLAQLVRLSRSAAPLPLERYVASYVRETPLPPRGVCRVSVVVGDAALWLTRPAPNEFPPCDETGLDALFDYLSPANMALVWSLLVCEHRVALCGTEIRAFSRVALALLGLLFPFQWQGVCIPVCPSALLEVILEAPVPFLVGGFTTVPERMDMYEGIVFVDLDADVVYLNDAPSPAAPPPRHAAKLRKQLTAILAERRLSRRAAPGTADALMAVPISNLESGVIQRDVASGAGSAHCVARKTREAFVRFFAATLSSYRAFVDGSGAFDFDGFVASRSPASKMWFAQTTETQAFRAFVADAKAVRANTWLLLEALAKGGSLSSGLGEGAYAAAESSGDESLDGLRFFDEKCDAKFNRSVLARALQRVPTPFLSSEHWRAQETFIVPPPSAEGVAAHAKFRAPPPDCEDGPLCPFARLDNARYARKLRRPRQLAEREPAQRTLQAGVREALRRFLDGVDVEAATGTPARARSLHAFGSPAPVTVSPPADRGRRRRPNLPDSPSFVDTLHGAAAALQSLARRIEARRRFAHVRGAAARVQALGRGAQARGDVSAALARWRGVLLDVLFAAWDRDNASLYHRAAVTALASPRLSGVKPCAGLALLVDEVAATPHADVPARRASAAPPADARGATADARCRALFAKFGDAVRRADAAARARALRSGGDSPARSTLARLRSDTPAGATKAAPPPAAVPSPQRAARPASTPSRTASRAPFTRKTSSTDTNKSTPFGRLASTKAFFQQPAEHIVRAADSSNRADDAALTSNCIKLQRARVYAGLKHLDDAEREKLFSMFQLQGKLRKRTLVVAIWSTRHLAEESAMVVLATAPPGAVEATEATARDDARRHRALASFAAAAFSGLAVQPRPEIRWVSPAVSPRSRSQTSPMRSLSLPTTHRSSSV
ncbi:AEX-3 domain-containing protein [Pelagophyceae sp. CCMP2097]|nr:AEX-3 domain-containing protein [Pelagophyceae sp. CCMP2097]